MTRFTYLQQSILNLKVEQLVVLELGDDALRQTVLEVVEDIGQTAEDRFGGKGERVTGLLYRVHQCEYLRVAKSVELSYAEAQYLRDGLLALRLVQLIRRPFVEEEDGNFLQFD